MAEKVTDIIVTTSDLSKILGLSDRRIRQLVQESILSQVTRGNFRLPEAVQAYIKYIQSGGPANNTGLNFKDEKTLLTKAQREKTEIELNLLKQTVHRGEDVKTALLPVLSSLKSRILAVPMKSSVQLLNKSDVTEIQIVIRKEIFEALREIANLDPEELIIQEAEARAREQPDGRRKNTT